MPVIRNEKRYEYLRTRMLPGQRLLDLPARRTVFPSIYSNPTRPVVSRVVASRSLEEIVQAEIDEAERKRKEQAYAPKKKNKLKRNQLCSCGSGKKWKQCCGKAKS